MISLSFIVSFFLSQVRLPGFWSGTPWLCWDAFCPVGGQDGSARHLAPLLLPARHLHQDSTHPRPHQPAQLGQGRSLGKSPGKRVLETTVLLKYIKNIKFTMSPILSKASVHWPREWIFPPAMDSLTYFIFHFFLSPLCRCQAPRFHTSCFQSSQFQWDTKPCTAPSERFNWLRWNFYGHTIQPWCSWRRLRFSPECKVHHQNLLYRSPCQFLHLKHTQGSPGSDHHGSAMRSSIIKPSHLKPSHLNPSHPISSNLISSEAISSEAISSKAITSEAISSHLKPSHLHRLVLAPAWNLETFPSTALGQGLESERHFFTEMIIRDGK